MKHRRNTVTSRARAAAAGDAQRKRSGGGAGESVRSVLQRPRVAGMSLAVKFTLLASVTIAVLMVLFGILAYTTSRNALEREIDAFGVNLARALALPEAEWWSADHGTLREAARRIGERFARYPAVVEEKYGIVYRAPVTGEESEGEAPPDRSPGSREEYERFRRELAREVSRNQERLRRLIEYRSDGEAAPSEIIDAFVLYEDQDKSVIRANPDAKTFQPTSGERRYRVERGGRTVTTDAVIIQGRFEDVGAARSFSYPIRDAEGNVTHRAYVFLSERRIQQRLRSLLLRILLCTVAFIAIGAAVSFVLTRQMTAPLQDLVDDIEIVTSGDFEHRTRAQTSDEIGLLARTFDRMVRSLHEAQSERTEHQALKHDLAVASEFHSKLVPPSTPVVAGYEIEVLHLAAGEIAGSYYDFLDLPGGRTGILVAEGSAAGLAGAMTLVMARSLLRSEAERGEDPDRILRTTNAALTRDIRKGMYIAVLLAVLDPPARRIEAFGAGNVSLLHYRSSEKKARTVVPDGIALGFDRGPVFDRSLKPTVIPLDPGDRIVLANHGPVHLRGEDGAPLGEERWRQIVERVSPKNSSAFVNIVGASLSRFRGEAEPHEDIVVVTLKAESRKSGS
jgi:serine phosphatase RsbU (regulator of sigma subunit)